MHTVIPCGPRHASAVMAIFNEAIATSTALYDYQPRDAVTIAAWFAAKEAGGYPVLGIEDAEGTLMAFASLGPFRAFPAYKYTAEHSLYVDSRFRRRGLGRVLLDAIIREAAARDFHMLIGGIDAENTASIALHRGLGFHHCATIRHAGFKFGRWLDLEFYQLILDTPAHPVDG